MARSASNSLLPVSNNDSATRILAEDVLSRDREIYIALDDKWNHPWDITNWNGSSKWCLKIVDNHSTWQVRSRLYFIDPLSAASFALWFINSEYKCRATPQVFSAWLHLDLYTNDERRTMIALAMESELRAR